MRFLFFPGLVLGLPVLVGGTHCPITAARCVRRIDSLVSAQVATDAFSGVVAVAHDGAIVYRRAAGLADRGTKAPMTMDSKLQIASATKLFTNIAIRQLEQAGKLALTDTVGKFLPDYPNAVVRSKVTIDQLLHHRSGIGSFWNDRWMATHATVRTVQDYLDLFARDSLLFAPGTNEAYSNGGYVVLGAIIEKVSGQGYHDYLRNHVFRPAGMTATVPYDRTVKIANVATGYTRQMLAPGTSGDHPNTEMLPGKSGPAGEHYTTAGDLVRLASALRAHKLLDSAHTAALLGERYARGSEFRANGGGPGMNAEFSMWPNGDVMVVLSNYDPPAATTIAQFIRQMEQEGDATSTLRVLDSLWARAYEKQDTALALRLYSANLAFTSSDGTVKTRDDEMADVRPQAGFVMNFFRTTPTEIRVSGDSGYVSGVAEWSFTAGGGTRQIRRAYSLTAQRSAAMGWTIVAVRMGAAPAVPNPGAVEIPLTKIGPFYYVDVRLNGKPFRFTLETGASFAAISTRAAKQLGLSADGARLDSLSFGTVTLRDVEARVTTLFDNAEFDGILSLPLLRDYVWTMDLARSRLILERGSLPAPNGRDVLPIAGKDRAQRLDIPMALGGQQVSAVLDTRYAGWVMTNDSLLPGVRLASPLREVGTARGPSLGEFRMRGARLVDAVDVGRYSLPQAPVVFRNVGGTIVGAAFLEQFAVTVDQVNGRIRFTRADSAIVVPAQPWEREGAQSTGATDAPTRTFGFRVAARPDGRLFIVQLDTASAAARLGIRENDEIVEFDGVPAARMNPQIYRTALARGGAVTIAVLRDGKRLDFSVESQMP